MGIILDNSTNYFKQPFGTKSELAYVRGDVISIGPIISIGSFFHFS